MLADRGDLLQPALGIDLEDLVHVALGQVEPAQVEGVGGRQVADRGLDRLAAAGDALEDPREDTAVLAVARPQELTFALLRNQLT